MLRARAACLRSDTLRFADVLRMDTLLLRDEMTDKTYNVRPRLVINAAGPWIDFTNRKLGFSSGFIGGTKGSHLVIKHDELRRTIGDEDGRPPERFAVQHEVRPRRPP